MAEAHDDGRLSYDTAIDFVRQHPEQAAFAATPVFGEDTQSAEGARVFIVEADAASGHRVRFYAAPFFSAATAADEILMPDDVPERVKELRFLPTRFDPAWLEDQVQILIQKLMQASSIAAPQMPDYASAPAVGAEPGTVFPVTFVGRERS